LNASIAATLNECGNAPWITQGQVAAPAMQAAGRAAGGPVQYDHGAEKRQNPIVDGMMVIAPP
jgi:hypothetical protein